MTRGNVYLDYNATTPVHEDVKGQLSAWAEAWGNASSIHQHGREAKKLLRDARQNMATLIGAHPMEIIFTAGGSESNNQAIKSFQFCEEAKTRNEIISTRVEHPSVLRTLEFMQEQGFVVHYVDVDKQGRINEAQYQTLLCDKTLLVTIMTANNEIGTLFPIESLAQMAKAVGSYFHTDAVQALGRTSFSVKDSAIDMASFSGHKFYALKGAGVLFNRRGTPVHSHLHGGGQERGRRAGTENTLAISSLGYMAKQLLDVSVPVERMARLRDMMESQIISQIQDCEVVASQSKRLPNTSCLVIRGVHGESLLMSLDVKGFSVSTGAACSSGSPEPSHVMAAIGLSDSDAQSTLRVSLGWTTTEDEVKQFIETLVGVVSHLRSLSSSEEVSKHG